VPSAASQVAEHEDGAARASLGVDHRGAGRAHRYLVPAGSEHPLATSSRRALDERAARHLAHPRARAEERPDLATDRLGRGHAGQLLGGRVQVGDAARAVEDDDAVLDRGEHIGPRRPRRDAGRGERRRFGAHGHR